jgi:hypothetical protein
MVTWVKEEVDRVDKVDRVDNGVKDERREK